ncbi:HdeA/HdeB family chaperone [Rhodoplanes sp. TEM]|uniref:HdeA/HdeB family chaperone n=1 Tax=Rhodoplanes tepidamans TaxID=200616 RepID=A0ABT5JI99_RHOTP|nr:MULTISPECIES: HdeA/HdeB family chaperone [Rhodoplanes]MDC7789248.1 HdeA/HdeB family chaperone [Rhodoplanes tepidamans]MDC7985814.1 HdeA/HdeB family chaperone [Rhodoplanes sp. TEM]MDQ0358860.1 acid stress chaperone HdeB [Rhodoplanes tepidamans]
MIRLSPVTRLVSAASIGIVLAAAAAAPAAAEKFDLSTMSCKQFLSSSKDDITITLAWLDAYYRDEDDPPIIDTDRLESNTKKLAAYCAENPSIGVITAADKLFD